MNPLIIVSFLIPASIALILIVLLIREREYLLPGRRNRIDRDRVKQDMDVKSRFSNPDRQSQDYLDLSGGTMGI